MAIECGARLRESFVVDEARSVEFLGPELRVDGTPSLLRDAETACRDLVLRSIVGTVRHERTVVDLERLRAKLRAERDETADSPHHNRRN